MEGYLEPFKKREYLTKGEIGCFLSHYFIWEKVCNIFQIFINYFKLCVNNVTFETG